MAENQSRAGKPFGGEMKSVLWKENAYINQIMQKMRSGNYCGLFVMNERQKLLEDLKNVFL